MEKFIPAYDLESLNEQQRQDYIVAVCQHMGVPENLNLVALTRIDDGEGPARLVAYAKRGATENVRNARGITISSLTSQVINGSIVFTAVGTDNKGRQEIATGAKYIDGLKDVRLDDALMTAQTRALRRLTLQFVGAGVLDESEVHQGRTVVVPQQASGLVLAAAQPSVQPSNAPGKDITPPKAEIAPGGILDVSDAEMAAVVKGEKTIQETFEAQQAKLRADAIAQLNAKATEKVAEPAEPKKKGRKPRAATVDLGPSEPVIAQIVQQAIINPITPETIPAVPNTVSSVSPISTSVETAPKIETPAVPAKPRLTPEQVKPYRQRLFRLVNDYLEPNGFTPKEGMGNSDKMKAFATTMFPDVANMAELTVEQWEKYLTNLETRAQANPKETVKYIEDTIGL